MVSTVDTMTKVAVNCLNNNLVYETVLAIPIDCHGSLYHIFQCGGRMRRRFFDVLDFGNLGKVDDCDVLIKLLCC